jgi:hypothetical protein
LRLNFVEDSVQILAAADLVVKKIIDEIHHSNQPIRRSGSTHRSKPQDIFRPPARLYSA